MGWNKIHQLKNCKHNPATHSQINIYIFNFKNNRILNEEDWFSNIKGSPYKFLRNNINMYYDHAIKFISFFPTLAIKTLELSFRYDHKSDFVKDHVPVLDIPIRLPCDTKRIKHCYILNTGEYVVDAITNDNYTIRYIIGISGIQNIFTNKDYCQICNNYVQFSSSFVLIQNNDSKHKMCGCCWYAKHNK